MASTPARRDFLKTLTTSLTAAGVLGSGAEAFATEPSSGFGPFLVSGDRLERAYAARVAAAERVRAFGMPTHTGNGDDTLYPSLFATYTKGLPHDAQGLVEPSAIQALLAAVASGDPAQLETVPLGAGGRRLTNPAAGHAFDMEGLDPQQHTLPPHPAFASAEAAGEMVEHYWMAVLRDVPFESYPQNALAAAAAAELTTLPVFKGVRLNGAVTPRTLFRDALPGALHGPYLSQFFWLPTPYGAELVDRRIRSYAPGRDHGLTWNDWLAIQNGFVPSRATLLPGRRYLRTGRDLARWVHVDVLFQAYFNACLVLGTPVADGGIGCPLNPSNPYLSSSNQAGFATWGAPFFKTLLCEVATRALKAVWYQKWFVHRRLRPEAFAARVHQKRNGAALPLHASVVDAKVVDKLLARNGTALLPLAFPEGSPTHPSYGSGHATVAGACVTILKALFDERHVIPAPVVPNADGSALLRYTGGALTVRGELHKLASNVATGRNIAGVHWRSDARESLLLGERVAVEILKDVLACGPETLADGIRFTGFSGEEVHVTAPV